MRATVVLPIVSDDPAVAEIAVVDARLQVVQLPRHFAAYTRQDVLVAVDFEEPCYNKLTVTTCQIKGEVLTHPRSAGST